MSTSDLPVTERGRATRRALLEAAEEVFGEVGYQRASIAEITRRAGVGQGTFYLYFPDKRAAFTELVGYQNQLVRETGARAIEGLTDRLDMERAGFAAFFEHIERHPGLYRIIRESEFVDEEAHHAHYRKLADRYAAGLQRAMDAGRIASDIDPEILAYILMGIAEFMGMRFVLWEHRLPGEAFDQLMAFVGRGLGGAAT